MRKLYKYLLLTLGSIFLIAGFIGIFLPLVPTTPFVLLAAFCFARSSNKLYKYLLNHRTFGEIITNFTEKKIISKKTKIVALSLMWLTLISSITFFMPIIWVKIIVFLIGVGVTIYIMRFPSG